MKIMPVSINSLGLTKVQKDKSYSDTSMLKEKQSNQSQPTFKGGTKLLATIGTVAVVSSICPLLVFIALPLGLKWLVDETDKEIDIQMRTGEKSSDPIDRAMDKFDKWLDSREKDDDKQDLEDKDDDWWWS